MIPARTLVCLTLAACGGTGGDDDDQTATTPDVAVRVNVVERGLPVASAKVFASSTDGEVTSELATDASGVAMVTAPGGGFVTALWQDADGNYLAYTVTRASDDESLPVSIDAAIPVAGTGPVGAGFSTNLPTGANTSDETDGCATGAGALATSSACAQPDGTFAILARAYQTGNPQYPPQGRVVGYQLAQHVAAGSSVTLGGPWILGGDIDLAMNDAPSGVVSLTASTGFHLGSVYYPEESQTFATVAASSDHEMHASAPMTEFGLTSFDVTYTLAYASTGGRTESAQLVQSFPHATNFNAASVDLVEKILPRIHDPVLDQDLRHHYRVTFRCDGKPSGGSFAVLAWTDAGGKTHTWIAQAGSVPVVSFPGIPDDAAAWQPTGDIAVPTIRLGGFGGTFSESKL